MRTLDSGDWEMGIGDLALMKDDSLLESSREFMAANLMALQPFSPLMVPPTRKEFRFSGELHPIE